MNFSAKFYIGIGVIVAIIIFAFLVSEKIFEKTEVNRPARIEKPTEIPAEWEACRSDADCTEVSKTCCRCNMGGITACVNRGFVANYEAAKDCPLDVICIAVIGCLKSCECVEGICKVI